MGKKPSKLKSMGRRSTNRALPTICIRGAKVEPTTTGVAVSPTVTAAGPKGPLGVAESVGQMEDHPLPPSVPGSAGLSGSHTLHNLPPGALHIGKSPAYRLHHLLQMRNFKFSQLRFSLLQIINVYNQEYESAAAFWPDVHGRIITALVISQVLLMGLLSTKKAAQSTPFLIALPVLTIWFHLFCKHRFESAFVKYPLQEAMMKDTLERAREPNLNLKGYLQTAYIHPVFKVDDDDEENDEVTKEWEQENLVATKRQSRRNTPLPSKYSGSSSPPSLPEVVREEA